MKAVNRKKTRWTEAQIKTLLEKTAKGNVRMHAFSEIARMTGRKTNSVRNYYYKYHAARDAQTNAQGTIKLVPFNKSEADSLLREIILGTSRGESVRSICTRLANNNRSKMLRFQNKYRAIILKDAGRINKMTAALEAQGFLVKSPITAAAPAYDAAKIIQMPNRQNEKPLSDADINNLFMGLVRLIKKSASDERIEALKAEIERLRNKQKKAILGK